MLRGREMKGLSFMVIIALIFLVWLINEDNKQGKSPIPDDYVMQDTLQDSINNFSVMFDNGDTLHCPPGHTLYIVGNRDDWFMELPSGVTVGYNAFKAVLREGWE